MTISSIKEKDAGKRIYRDHESRSLITDRELNKLYIMIILNHTPEFSSNLFTMLNDNAFMGRGHREHVLNKYRFVWWPGGGAGQRKRDESDGRMNRVVCMLESLSLPAGKAGMREGASRRLDFCLLLI
jgi:hypothetical protein